MNVAEIALVSVEQTCSDSACQQTELDNPGPAPDGGSSAWAFLAASCTIELMVWGVTYAYGSFQDYHEHNEDSPLYGSNTTSLSAVGTLVIGMQHLVPLLSHGVAEAYPHLLKRLTFLSLVLSALCLLIASFSESIGLVISFQGLFFGLTAGNTFTPIVIWLPQWFDRRRGLATGIIFGGSGVGGIIFPLIFNALLQHVGFHWTLRVWALLHVSITGFALFVLRPRIPPIKPHLVPKKRELLPPGPRPILNVQFALNVSASLLAFGVSMADSFCFSGSHHCHTGDRVVHHFFVRCIHSNCAWSQLHHFDRRTVRLQRCRRSRLLVQWSADRCSAVHTR